MAGGSKQALRHTTTMQSVLLFFQSFFLMKIKLNNSFLRRNYSNLESTNCFNIFL